MATITPNVSPGAYMDPQAITFTFSGDITGVAITKNAAPPSISKYIAYDTLTPPNPFLAITEDGRGRVVYDGGFPKFYNTINPAAPANFAALSAAGKYLHNAIIWIANPTKVAAGNKKVLFLGDSPIGVESYPLKGTVPTGFITSLTAICNVAGYVPTFKDISDYDGINLNPTLAELEQYCCVVMLSTAYIANARITAQAVNDMVTYRENGNGLVFITDHGTDFASIADVGTATEQGFFKTGNAVISKFGAYFTGNFDRTPVNVGFLRNTYGDHPLYVGLADTDFMPAGGSESKVVVSPSNIVAPGSLAPVVVDTSGLNTINILATLTDGSVITSRIVYNIQGQEFVFMKSINRNTSIEETNAGVAWTDLAGKMNLSLDVDGSTLGTVWGEILVKGKRVGETYYSGGVSNVYWYAGSAAATPIRHGDSVQLVISIPFTYSKNLVADRQEIANPGQHISLASLVKNARTPLSIAGMSNAVKKMFDVVKPLLPAGLNTQKTSMVNNTNLLRDLTQNKLQIIPALTARIYKTSILTTTAVSAAAANPGTVIIDGATNTVYAYKNGSIQAIAGLKMQDFFGSPRVITSTVDGLQYRLETNGLVTAL